MERRDMQREKDFHLQELLDAVPDDRVVACLHDQDSVILHDGQKELGRIPLSGLLKVSLIDDSTVRRSYGAVKLLFLGPLAFLFPKKTVREAFRLHVEWQDQSGNYHENDIRIRSRTMAEYRLKTMQSLLIPEIREQLAQKAAKAKMLSSLSVKQEKQNIVEPSPFITCGGCTVEFRKSDLPPGGKCPVCGRKLKM